MELGLFQHGIIATALTLPESFLCYWVNKAKNVAKCDGKYAPDSEEYFG